MSDRLDNKKLVNVKDNAVLKNTFSLERRAYERRLRLIEFKVEELEKILEEISDVLLKDQKEQ